MEALLGARLDQVTNRALLRLVENHVVEEADIDFKAEPHEDGEKLAADVTAMANGVGGVLIIGVDEEDGAAVGLLPGPLTDEVTDRMKQMLAEYVAPYLPTEIKRVPLDSDPTRGFYLVVVPRSPDAPHAVASRKKGTLRYYQRDGGRNRPLAESEVAEAYRGRFRGEKDRVDRMEAVRETGTKALSLAPTDGTAWIVMTLVPQAPGALEISARGMQKVDLWARGYGGFRGEGPFERWSGVASTGVGRITLTSVLAENARKPRYCHAELHRDGSGFVAAELFNVRRQGTGTFQLLGIDLFIRAAGLLRLLVDHAVGNCGTQGEALVRCELVAGPGTVLELGYLQMGSFWERFSRTRPLEAPHEGQAHTVALAPIAGGGAERLAAARIVLTDVFHAFGLAEVLFVTAEGHFRQPYWDRGILTGWTSMVDVPRVEETVEV